MDEKENDLSFIMVNHADCRPCGTSFKHIKCLDNYGLSFNFCYGTNDFGKSNQIKANKITRLNPCGITTSNSSLLISDNQLGVVNIYSIDDFINSFTLPYKVLFKHSFPSVTDVSLLEETFFVTDHLSKKVHICSKVGVENFINSEIFLPQSLELSGICVTNNKQIIVSDSKACNITICEQNGDLLHTFGGADKLDYPQFLCWSSRSERIFIADTCSSKVHVFNIYGQHDFSFGSHIMNNGCFLNPSGIDVDDSGRIFVADETLNNVQVFDKNGNLIDNFGESGFKCGHFHSPKGLSVCNGKVYIADSLNYRVQVFEEKFNH
ncbi:tripartite motif-containing protein 2 [Hydra vulgaris]|uniref:tripartite motif-containing protein 2 n=1 Tax=Hydra vulgaris TaxID=6087 RepID=UPI000641479A|nr:tripartite motif-containing protein 2 [Hydra vulgaris]